MAESTSWGRALSAVRLDELIVTVAISIQEVRRVKVTHLMVCRPCAKGTRLQGQGETRSEWQT